MLDKRYSPKDVEQGKYENWKEKGYFTAGDKTKDPFCIVIPPPNVTVCEAILTYLLFFTIFSTFLCQCRKFMTFFQNEKVNPNRRVTL